MMRETLRDVLVNLEQHGKLIRVFKSVDVGWEVACLVKWKTSQDTTFQLSSALWVYQPDGNGPLHSCQGWNKSPR
jgi:hypothetical protein